MSASESTASTTRFPYISSYHNPYSIYYSPLISSYAYSNFFGNATIDNNYTNQVHNNDIQTTCNFEDGIYSTNINSSTLNLSYACIHFLIYGNIGPDKECVQIYFDEAFPALQSGYSPQSQTNTLIFSSERFFRENLQLLFGSTVEERSPLIRISFEKVRENQTFEITHIFYTTANAIVEPASSSPGFKVGMIIGIIIGILFLILLLII